MHSETLSKKYKKNQTEGVIIVPKNTAMNYNTQKVLIGHGFDKISVA
jgi:hypothetical protein